MALLLCVDTALEQASVSLSNTENIVASLTNSDQKNHAAFLQPAIQEIMLSSGISFSDIDAVAVVNGPGSYTGLRVGLASAKGICYVSGKPIILLNTLEVMAKAAIEKYKDEDALYCPVIDARRNEVFAAVYDYSLQPLLLPQPVIIDENSFQEFLQMQKIYFFGSGHKKCGEAIVHGNARFAHIAHRVNHINELSQQKFQYQDFGDIAYAEPFYTKDFYMPGR